MLRVLEVCTESSPAYALVFQRAKIINQRYPQSIRCDLLCSDGPEVQQMRDQGMTVRVATLHRSLRPWHLAQSLVHLLKVLRQHNYDAIHLHFGVPSLLGRILAPFIRQPTWLYQSHGYSIADTTGKVARLAYLATERLLKHSVTYALFQSQEDLRIAHQYRLLDEQQMIFLGNGVDTQRFKPVAIPAKTTAPLTAKHPASLSPPGHSEQKKMIFGMVARFDPIKHYQLFIDAIKHLRLQTSAFKAYMIGHGPLKPMIQAQIAAHELYDHVEILPYRQDMPGFYQQIDVGVLTSLGEGMPRALLEPMACGKPVLCTDVKGSREAVVDGITGFILPIDDPPLLAEKMHWCIQNPHKLGCMGQAARRHIVKHHAEQQVIERLTHVYLRCPPAHTNTASSPTPAQTAAPNTQRHTQAKQPYPTKPRAEA